MRAIGERPRRLTMTQGINLAWLSSRCLVSAPWNINCRQCRDACPENALEVLTGDDGPVLAVSDKCTNCHDCLSACDTEALMASSVTFSRRDLLRGLSAAALPEIPAADAAPAPRRRWRMEALQGDSQAVVPMLHPQVSVAASRCDASGLCSQLCPSGALQADPSGALHFDSDYCLGCGHCESVCPGQAITVDKDCAPSSSIVRQAEQRQCGECGRTYQEVHSGSLDDQHWDQLPLCPACHRDQSLMHNDVMSLFRTATGDSDATNRPTGPRRGEQ